MAAIVFSTDYRLKNPPTDDMLVLQNQTGGPSVPVPLGRRDGLVSLASNVRRNIIDTGFSVDAMAASFTAKGLTLDDLVTLSGTQRRERRTLCPAWHVVFLFARRG